MLALICCKDTRAIRNKWTKVQLTQKCIILALDAMFNRSSGGFTFFKIQ